MASSMPGMDMGGMQMGGTGSSSSNSSMAMDMTMMSAVFQTSIETPLYSLAWTPSSTATYAASCTFLTALAIVFRFALAFRARQEQRWLDADMDRRYVIVNGRSSLSERLGQEDGNTMKEATITMSENGVEENVVVVRRRTRHSRPWRLSVDPIRAAMDTVAAGMGYLLMLAVMTMNVGYFLSVLGGVFLGSMMVGRYAVAGDH